MIRYSLLFLLLLFFKSSECQSVEFFREDLVFTIDSVYFTVDGSYFFRNTSNKAISFPIAYPVPWLQLPENIDTLIVYDPENPGKSIRVFQKDTLYNFNLEIGALGQKVLKIAYRQKHNNRSARYILTTTATWGKPFEEAAYDLVVPGYLKVEEFSYEPDNFTGFKDDKIYHWKKKGFMPGKDFVIKFHKTIE
jgi:hypothetical protein